MYLLIVSLKQQQTPEYLKNICQQFSIHYSTTIITCDQASLCFSRREGTHDTIT